MAVSQLRALFLVEGEPAGGTSPSARYRVYELLPHLERAGVGCDVRRSLPAKYCLGKPPLAGWLASRPALRAMALGVVTSAMVATRLLQLQRASRYDVVVLQRDLLPLRTITPFLERRLSKLNRRVVFDIDDSVFARHSAAGMAPRAYRSPIRVADKIDRIVRAAAHVTAGNEYLAAFARRSNPNVTVIPTVLDTEVYRPRPRPDRREDVVVGWIGTHLNLLYVRQLAPVFESLSRESPFRLRIVSNTRTPFECRGVDVDQVEWSLDREMDDVLDFDVGIMPLADDEWARGKCGLKALQYMACGIPCVVSPVGVNAEIVTPGVNGLTAATSDEWREALRSLVSDLALRRRLGDAGRQTVVERYSAHRWAPELARILRRVAG